MTEAIAPDLREYSSAQPAPADEAEIKATVERLAKLKPAAYERERLAEAHRLGFRSSVLDDVVKDERGEPEQQPGGGRALKIDPPEPWPDPVDGASLLSEIAATFLEYVAFPNKEAADAVALWTMQTHCFQYFAHTPRLIFKSAEKRCGKTTALKVVGKMSSKPLLAANISPSALFRAIELVRPTMLIDEADTFLRESNDLKGIVNSGHSPEVMFIKSVEIAGNHEPRGFSTWCPVAIASIGEQADTIMDRSIIVKMQRRIPSQKIKRLGLHDDGSFARIARQCARCAADNAVAFTSADPEIPGALNDRAADNWRPLLAIADRAGGDWPKRARAAALRLSGETEGSDSTGTKLLADLRNLFAERGADAISSTEIVTVLGAMEDRLWSEWKAGKPITPRQLATQLSAFDVSPVTIRTDGGTPKGYRLDALADAFARYLPSQSATTPQPLPEQGCVGFSIRNMPSNVADLKTPQALPEQGCGGVADAQPDLGGVGANGAGWEIDV